MKTTTLLWKFPFFLLFACDLQAASVSFRLSGSLQALDPFPNPSTYKADAFLDEDGGSQLAHLTIANTSDYYDFVDCADFGIHCGCDIRPQVSSSVNISCGKTYTLTLNGTACAIGVTASLSSAPAGYIYEFRDNSNNALSDNKTSVKITSSQTKIWKVSLKPKRVRFTVDSLSADGRSQAQAKLSFLNGTGGYFTGNPIWSIAGEKLGCTIDSSNGWIRAGIEAGEITVRATDSSSGKTVSGSLRLGCQSCDKSCGIGQGIVGNLRNALAVGLGDFLCENSFMGSIRLPLTSPAASLSTPAGLIYDATNTDNALPEVLRDGTGALRQILAAQCLADVVTTVANSEYEIRFYWPENAGAKVGGFYQPTNSPFKTWRVTSLVGGNTQFRIVEDPAGANNTNSFTWNAGDNGWTLNRGALSQERKIVQESLSPVAPRETSRRSETTEISIPGGTAIASRVIKTYAILSLNGGALQRTNILVEERSDGGTPDASAANLDQVTSYFYAATATPDGHEKMQRITRSDGSWNHYEYDTSNRIATAYSAWLDSTPPADIDTAPTSIPYSKTVYAYTPMSGSGDPGTNDFVTPRQVDSYVNDGTTVPLVSRSFVTLTLDTNRYPATDVRRDISARNSSVAWNDTNNPVTITRTFASGALRSAVQSVDRPDGTRTVYSYAETTQDVRDGAAGVAQDLVTDGRRTTTTKTARGYLQTNVVTDILTGKKLVSDVWSVPGTNDPQGRFTLLTHLDGTTGTYLYDCCNLTQTTDRDGATTVFTPDSLKRVGKTTVFYSASLVNGIQTSNTFDAQGAVTRTTRIGSDGTSIAVLPLREYDRAGRVVREQNALGGYTTVIESTNASGGRKVSTTYADGGTRIEEYYHDGRLAKIYGTATQPSQSEYLLSPSGELGVKETKLDAAGTLTSEWAKSYTDFPGRDYKTVFADATTGDESDNPYSQRFYKDNGQLWKERDPDGVLTVSIFTARGEVEYTMIGQKTEPTTPPTAPDTSGEHRITRVEQSVSSYTDGATYDTLRTRVTEWTNLNSASTIVSSETHSSLDGLREWSVAYPNDTFKQVTKTEVQYGSTGARTITTTYPDNSFQISLFSYGRLASVTRYAAGGGSIAQSTFQYDTHGRLWTSTDARNGATTTYYNNADQLSSVISPPPTNGQPAQTRSVAYDLMGRPNQVIEPDGTIAYTRYYSNGLVKLTWGARTVPSGYEYDAQWRITKLYTWQSFVAPNPALADPPFPSGAVTTLWHYDPYRGWPQDKRYADNTGPDYTYTAAGRLKTSSAWRNVPGSPGTRVTTTNTFDFESAGNNANRKVGYQARLDYNDGTPSLVFDYDRRGRGKTVTQGTGGATITTTLGWHPTGTLDSESYAGSFLDTLAVVSDNLDPSNLLRRESLETCKAGALIGSARTYAYDNASRLQSVAHGINSANYAYAANSDLVATNTFKANATTRVTTTPRFDFLNRLQSITSLPSAAGQPAFSSAYLYNQANQRTRRTEGNGAAWNFGYDELGQLIFGKKQGSDGAPVMGQQFEYIFDWIGNRLATSAGGDERGAGLRVAPYVPNTLNQYASRTVPTWVSVLGDASSNATVTVNLHPTKRQGDYFWTELWFNNSTGAVYQAVTNVAALRRTNLADVVSSTVGSLFQPKTPEVFLHDGDGNLTNDGRWSLNWDAENRLTRAETIASALPSGVPRQRLDLASDYLGRRVRKSVSNYVAGVWQLALDHRYLYDGVNLIATLDASQTLLYSFNWGSDLSGTLQGAGGVGGLISMTIHSGPLAGTYFYCYDGNGNVIALVNAADGTVVARYEYGPFGELIRATGPLAFVNPFRFSTKFQDDETGLLYYGFRYYNPSTGRFLSRDPFEEEGGLNLYAFVLNHPVSGVDPLGLALYAFDGTGNDGTKVPAGEGTSVFILQSGYRGQNVEYYPGVGSAVGTRALGGLTGLGGQLRLEKAYQDFLRNYQSGDTDIDIIGFSRGAALARAFANLIYERGDGSGKETITTPIGKGNTISRTVYGKPCRIPEIRYVGLFDSVASFGAPGNNVNIGYRLGLPPNVKAARQAVAQDEKRFLFPLTPLGSGAAGQVFGERRFPGDHSDIGHGHGKDSNDLSNDPLGYVWSGGIAVRVPFGPLPSYPRIGNTTPHDLSTKFPYNLFPKRPR